MPSLYEHRERQPHLDLIDWDPPPIDGYEVVETKLTLEDTQRLRALIEETNRGQ